MNAKVIVIIGTSLCSVPVTAKNLFPAFQEAICKVYVGPIPTSSYKIVAVNPTSRCTCAYARQYHDVIFCTHVEGHLITKKGV
jgi:hypothetical protein